MNNYFEHEEQVKYVDGLLAKSQDWQWIIEYIEKNFTLEDVSDWEEFQTRDRNLREVLLHFIKIVEVCRTIPKIENKVCIDLYVLARYFNGVIDRDECKSCITTKFGYALYFVIWLTKLENQDNKTQYVVDYRLLQQKNFWDLINMDSFELYKEDIYALASDIQLSGFENARKCLSDNIEKKYYKDTGDFVKKYKEIILSSDAFNFNRIEREDFITWQEEYLIDMLQISIRHGELVPIFSNGIKTTPDFTLWTEDILSKIKNYFNCEEIDFVIETISLIKFRKVPSNNTIILHCKLLSDIIKNAEKSFEILNSSSFKIISFLFKERMMSNVTKKEEYIEFLKLLHDITEPEILDKIINAGIPLSKEQKLLVRSFYKEKYKKIETITNISELSLFLRVEEIPKQIDNEYYLLTVEAFEKYINSCRDIRVVDLFYYFMKFLININSTNQNVDKKLIKQHMISTQQLWEQKYYKEQCSNLQTFEHTTSVQTKELVLYNEQVIRNPIFAAKSCICADKESICKIMEEASEHAIVYLFSSISLTSVYPMKMNEVNCDKHDIDIMLRNIIDDINDTMGYKFLNNMKTDIYLSAVHKRYKDNAYIMASLFTKEEQVYRFISENVKYELISYECNLKLAHLTQLFPILEMKIRELGTLTGIVPFKESITDFMKYKDPSSVLRELLQEIYSDLNGFENVPDLLFIYNFMYNSNSLNIRNECMHGRDFLSGGGLKFAFKMTLLAIYMLIFRIKIIEENTEDNDI
ncbi:hypothetical protein ACV3ZD_13590 [Clostridium perfringens]|uniref:hypothetical protein n=1 Tax=Clostridium perfringens TaxID=1502 RepID=UPI000776ACBE|nr:hypothetical protein [Clostridium perfringens]AMN31538.1 hypothetical protein JFP55_00840 [Clostridium perfringens]MBI6037347.1 hypothetical protein [Clostridium perfringens]MBO3411632.1 hypothetical protein [Clostridium perfringens]MBO3433740.1 hypothetical protein [Clostridium perfringens]MDJ8944620.1 hypothetical protein [Clostridium perfringens]